MLFETNFTQDMVCDYATIQNIGTGGFLSQVFTQDGNCLGLAFEDTVTESSKFYLGNISEDEFAMRGLENSFFISTKPDDQSVGCDLSGDDSQSSNIFTMIKNPQDPNESFIKSKFGDAPEDTVSRYLAYQSP